MRSELTNNLFIYKTRNGALSSNKVLTINSSIIILILVLVLSILTAIVISFDDVPRGYENLPLLPLSFGLASLLFFKIYFEMQKNIAVLLILGGYFIRAVITPLAFVFGNYTTSFRLLYSENINSAVFIMIYEVLIVFGGMFIYLTLKKRPVEDIYHADDFIAKEHDFRKFNIMILLSVLFCFAVFLYIPEISEQYTTIFGNSDAIVSIDYVFDDVALRGTLKRILFSLFTYVLSFIRYVVPVHFIQAIYKKNGDSAKGIVKSLLFLLFPFLIVGTTNIEPFFGLILNCIIIKKLFPRNGKKLVIAIWVLGVLLVISIFSAKLDAISQWTGTSGFATLSQSLNAYFPGVGNAAAMYTIIDTNPLRTLFYDFYSTIPFRGSIFGFEEITLTNLFDLYNNIGGNIVPCVSHAEHYLGFIFAPIVPMGIALTALKMREKAKKSTNFWQYYYFVFFMMFAAFAPNIYNIVIYFSFIFKALLPVYILIKLINKKKERRVDFNCISNGELSNENI